MPRLLPVLGQVWADFKKNNMESVQKQIPPSHRPPKTFGTSQPSILKGSSVVPLTLWGHR